MVKDFTGGPHGDFGIKYNITNGGPAPEKITEAIFARTKEIDRYKILDTTDINLDKLSITHLGEMAVEVIDPVEPYARLMESLFDFKRIRELIKGDFRLCIDSMHAVTSILMLESYLKSVWVLLQVPCKMANL